MFNGIGNLSNMLPAITEDNLKLRDPFVKAKDEYNKKQIAEVSPSQPQGAAAPAANSSLISSLNSSPSTDFRSSGLPKILQKVGVDDKGISINPLGRIQLISRLQNKFGLDYQSNPNVLDIISKFDEALKNNPQSSAAEINGLASSGERTLSAILGGSF